MVAFIKTVTCDCRDALITAAFWAAALGSNVDEDSTAERAYVEAPGWGGPNLWFQRVAEPSATVMNRTDDLVVMQDPDGNEFCVE